MSINYRSMLVCPLGLTRVAQIFQKVACFCLYLLSFQFFYPNLPIFLHGYIRHIRDIFQLCQSSMPMASNFDWNHHLRANTAFILHKGGSLSFVRRSSICWCLIYAIYHKNFLQVSARIFKNLQGSASFCKTIQLRTIWRSEADLNF